ncbi:MAG: cytochrome c maturation protein CcmE [Leptospiraceae bacterium]|nr:cytochrome c maturation protein CcmE [Leptospiraceae bacterium]MCK6381658.1 cytochrome c maturation protein CcmE [Leptospiraceae bacterium]
MKAKFAILISVISISLGLIAYFSSKETSFILLDANELAADPAKYSGDFLRVRGFVKVGTLSREGKEAKFILEMDKKEIPIHFDGSTILPDTFKEGVRARVDGKLKNGVLVSNHIETKCASKYEADYKDEKGKSKTQL